MSDIPNLFGRVTAVLVDHETLHEVFTRIRRACGPASTQSLPQPGLCEELNDQLHRHFEAEEVQGYFGTLATERPDLEADIAARRDEHDRIRAAATALVNDARAEPWHDLAPRVAALLDLVESHEAAEHRLVRAYLSWERNR